MHNVENQNDEVSEVPVNPQQDARSNGKRQSNRPLGKSRVELDDGNTADAACWAEVKKDGLFTFSGVLRVRARVDGVYENIRPRPEYFEKGSDAVNEAVEEALGKLFFSRKQR